MKLWLIRHAESSGGSAARSDFARPLADRGRQDGSRMAAWLATQQAPATWIWTSDALRAADTARFVAEGFAAVEPLVVQDHRLYDARAEALLEVIRETPPEVTSAAVVAHNPGTTELANLLAGTTVTSGLPTFGIARFAVPGPWSALALGCGSLELIISPEQLPEQRP